MSALVTPKTVLGPRLLRSLRSSDSFWSHSGRTFFPVCLVLPGYYISLLALWGNKNWPPSMKVKKVENVHDKSVSTGCKWSSLIAPGTENPLSHPILKLEEFPFPIIRSKSRSRLAHKKPGVKKFSHCVSKTFDFCFYTLGPYTIKWHEKENNLSTAF